MAKPLMDPGLQYLYSQFSEVDGTAPDPRLYSALVQLYKVRNDGYTKLDASNTRRRLAQIDANLQLAKNTNDTIADLIESRSASSRVTSKNFTDLKRSKEEIDAKLTEALSAPTPAWAAADNAFNTTKGGGTPGLRAAATALVDWQRSVGGRAIDPSNAEIAPLMNRFSQMALKKNLNDTTVDELMNALGQNVPPSLEQPFRALVQAGWTRFNDITTLRNANSRDLAWMGQNAGQFSAGAPGAAEAIKQLRDIARDTRPALQAALGGTAADIQMERQLLLDENAYLQQLEKDVKRMEAKVYGGENIDPIGRLVATPEFRSWAESNGYQPGAATYDEKTGALTYSPNADDMEAVALYNYQAKTGKYHPLRRSKSTGALVRVTIEDPASQEQVLAKYKNANDRFYLDDEGGLVIPSDAMRDLKSRGLMPSTEYAVKGGKAYLRVAGKVVDAQTGAAVDDPPTDLKFNPALRYDGKKVRYLTIEDVNSPEKVAALAQANDIGADTGDAKDAEALAAAKAAAPIREVGNDEVREKWSRQYTGYLDTKNAADMTGNRTVVVNGQRVATGPNAISLNGGEIIIPSNIPATVEVLSVKERAKLGDIVKGWRRRMTDAHVQRLGEAPNLVPVTDGVSYVKPERLEAGELLDLGEQAAREYGQQKTAGPTGPENVSVPFTDVGGTRGQAVVPETSAAAVTATRTGVEVTGTGKAQYRTPDGKVYEADGSTGTIKLISGGKSGEKTAWTVDELRNEPALQAALSKASPISTEAPAAPGAGGMQMSRFPEGVDVTRVGSRAYVDYARPEETSLLERLGAGAAELFIPGSPEERAAVQRGEVAPPGEPDAAPRRVLGGVLDRMRQRRAKNADEKAAEESAEGAPARRAAVEKLEAQTGTKDLPDTGAQVGEAATRMGAQRATELPAGTLMRTTNEPGKEGFKPGGATGEPNWELRARVEDIIKRREAQRLQMDAAARGAGPPVPKTERDQLMADTERVMRDSEEAAYQDRRRRELEVGGEAEARRRTQADAQMATVKSQEPAAAMDTVVAGAGAKGKKPASTKNETLPLGMRSRIVGLEPNYAPTETQQFAKTAEAERQARGGELLETATKFPTKGAGAGSVSGLLAEKKPVPAPKRPGPTVESAREPANQPADVTFGRDLGEGSLTTTTARPLQVVPPAKRGGLFGFLAAQKAAKAKTQEGEASDAKGK